MKKKSINKLKKFTFPEYNFVIEAESIEKAVEKAKNYLLSKK